MAAEPTTHEAYRGTRRFDALDGLRALAGAAVVWHHSSGDQATGFFGRSVGVTTFFVISGFLITRMLFQESDRTGTISVARFWARRALRIFPLYYGVLALYVVLVARFEHGTPSGAGFWASLPWYLTFTTNWFVGRTPGERVIFYFAWSLAVQEQFYLVWPIVLRFVRRRWAVVLPLAFLLTADVAGWAADAGWLHRGLAYRAFVSLDSPIFLGVLAAFLLQNRHGFRVAQRIAEQPWSVPAALVLVVTSGMIPEVPQDLFGLCITYLVIASVLAPPPLARVLGHPLPRHVGNVSFGIYLLHMLALNAVRGALPWQGPAVLFGLGFPLSILAATASRRWFERIFLKLRDVRLGSSALPEALAASGGPWPSRRLARPEAAGAEAIMRIESR